MRIRRASNRWEEEFWKRVERLRKSIDPLLPRPVGACPKDAFEKLQSRLEEVRENRDDPKRLDHLRRWGDDMPRSLAGVLRTYLDEELPPLVTVRLGDGEVPYAPVASAPKEMQIAVQNYDVPRRLLLAYVPLTRKGWSFFAVSDGVVSPGSSSVPPPEYLQALERALPYRVTRHGKLSRCSHLEAAERRPYLEIHWTDADLAWEVCDRCTKDDRHLLASISGGAAIRDPEESFPVSAHRNIDCRGGADCPHQRLPEIARATEKRYHLGRIGDRELLQEYVTECNQAVARRGGTLFIAGGICYGQNTSAFIEALHPNEVERRALTAVLPEVSRQIDLDEPRASRALEELWRDHAETIVGAIVDDPERAEAWVAEGRGAPGRVAELLRRAARDSTDRAALGALPQYERLVPEAAFVDAIAREARINGNPAAERRLEQTLPREGRERGLAWGLLLAMERGPAHNWQFADTERQLGEALQERARALLAATPETYDAALGGLLAAAGVTNWGERSGSG
jgi:hypothetical protein